MPPPHISIIRPGKWWQVNIILHSLPVGWCWRELVITGDVQGLDATFGGGGLRALGAVLVFICTNQTTTKITQCTRRATSNKNVGVECRHDMRPSVQLPSVSGVSTGFPIVLKNKIQEELFQNFQKLLTLFFTDFFPCCLRRCLLCKASISPRERPLSD